MLLQSPATIIPPVEVPAIKSKIWEIGFFVLDSISARIMAGIIPLMPPPSTDKMYFTTVKFICVFAQAH